jgi:hypothetical protein
MFGKEVIAAGEDVDWGFEMKPAQIPPDVERKQVCVSQVFLGGGRRR